MYITLEHICCHLEAAVLRGWAHMECGSIFFLCVRGQSLSSFRWLFIVSHCSVITYATSDPILINAAGDGTEQPG